MVEKTECPVCASQLKKYEERHDEQNDFFFYECPRCGPFKLDRSSDGTVTHYLKRNPKWPAILSHAIYRATRSTQWALFKLDPIIRLLESSELPTPQEQLDNLIKWVGDNQLSLGNPAIHSAAMIAAVGSFDEASLIFICDYAKERGLIESPLMKQVGDNQSLSFFITNIRLTFEGWRYLDSLKLGAAGSHMAFMAMQFGHAETNAIYREHFKPAVEQTGFRLKRLDEGQPAGLIDDRLRVEIRQARFLIADLTLQNKGAYWEAGYAEGLGKPVIYTCRKDVFDQKGTIHFDTNHHLTVLWESGKMAEATAKLKDTIRATFPSDATMSD